MPTLEDLKIAIAARREKNADLEWLHDGEVEHIAALLYVRPDDYTILPSTPYLPRYPQHIPAAGELAQIRAKINNNGIHVFILGTMNPKRPRNHGHWISVVATRDSYIVLDSVNGPDEYMVNMVKILDHTLGLEQR